MYAVMYPKDASVVRGQDDCEPDYRLKYFVVTDLSSEHLPWDYIIDKGIYMEKVASCRLFSHDFIREEPMKIYLTHNLWTCDCRQGKFIHCVEKPFCMSCRTYDHRLKDWMNIVHMRDGWHASTDVYPYWQEISAIHPDRP